MTKLTPKQQAFCDFYIECGNATEAAAKAGYSKKTCKVIGAENLTKPYIRAYVDQRLDELSGERIASAEEVLAYLTSAMRGEVTETAFQGIGGGDQDKVEIPISPKDRNKAAELLGKRYGIWTDSVSVSVKDTAPLEKLASLIQE